MPLPSSTSLPFIEKLAFRLRKLPKLDFWVVLDTTMEGQKNVVAESGKAVEPESGKRTGTEGSEED